MSIDVDQLRDVIIRPALSAINLVSDSAIALLLGTAAQETGLGTYIKQLNTDKGGWGIYQMQSATFDYVWEKYISNSLSMKSKIQLYLGYTIKPNYQRMASDLGLATIMTRLYYYSFTTPFPDANDIEGFGKYWKSYWNTSLGRGTSEEFVTNYNKYVLKK